MEYQNRKSPYVSLKKLSKNFGPTKALNEVDLDIFPGEVIGIVGPNGAGKSTLIKTMTGVLEATDGNIFINGECVQKYDALAAKNAGIICAYQDLSLCSNLSVYENFAMLNMNHNLFDEFNWRKTAKKSTHDVINKYFPGNSIDVDSKVKDLSLANQQIVEICKALMTSNLKVLILDEPTSSLSTELANQLHNNIETIKKSGVSVIYISHKLDEILKITDRVMIMRNGHNEGEYDTSEVTFENLVNMMGGNEKNKNKQNNSKSKNNNDVLINIADYNSDKLHHINFNVKRGEIVGVSGLDGSGQVELLNLIYKAYRSNKRNIGITINGEISFVSGNRKDEGVFPLWNIADNITISKINKESKMFFDKNDFDSIAEKWYSILNFKAEGIKSPIMSLSGGNQQKALISRGIVSDADVILLKDPTSGVDIETKQEIYKLLYNMKDQGRSIVLYSTEDSEMLICDRTYILSDGCIINELEGDEITVNNIVDASFSTSYSNKTIKAFEGKEKKADILSNNLFLPIMTMIVIFLYNVYLNKNILSYSGLRLLLSSSVPLIMASLSQMYIALCGDTDMGSGYSIGLVNVLVAVVLSNSIGLGILSLVIFVMSYAFMGRLIHLKNIPSIIVTLGFQFIWLGIGLVISPNPGGTVPAWLNNIHNFKFPLIPLPIFISIVSALCAYALLYNWKYGIVLRGVGNNKDSVERSGWSCIIAQTLNYTISGIFIVFAGLSVTAISMSSDINSSSAYTMLSIATIILGGCSTSGGEVEPVGVVFASIAMSLITVLLTSLKIDSNLQMAVTGLILLIVLSIKRLSVFNGGYKDGEKN